MLPNALFSKKVRHLWHKCLRRCYNDPWLHLDFYYVILPPPTQAIIPRRCWYEVEEVRQYHMLKINWILCALMNGKSMETVVDLNKSNATCLVSNLDRRTWPFPSPVIGCACALNHELCQGIWRKALAREIPWREQERAMKRKSKKRSKINFVRSSSNATPRRPEKRRKDFSCQQTLHFPSSSSWTTSTVNTRLLDFSVSEALAGYDKMHCKFDLYSQELVKKNWRVNTAFWSTVANFITNTTQNTILRIGI